MGFLTSMQSNIHYIVVGKSLPVLSILLFTLSKMMQTYRTSNNTLREKISCRFPSTLDDSEFFHLRYIHHSIKFV